MKKIVFILFLFLVNESIPQNSGNTGLSFLKFGFGARNLALGDVGNTIANDLTALYYNPSNLVSNSNNEIMVNHNSWIQDIKNQMLGIKTFMWGIPIAVGLNISNISDIEYRTIPGEAQSKFNANYFFGSISSALNLSDQLSIGGSIKYIYEGILNDEATGLGFDFGANYKLPFDQLSISAVIRNIGSMNALRNQSTKLPSEFRIGTKYSYNLNPYDLEFIVAGEYQKYLDSDSHLNFGLEIVYKNIFALRGGYQSNYEIRDFSAGFGLFWGHLKFDYAFVPFNKGWGSGNIFSLAFRF